ncbi:MAG: MFS transporter [Anaerolineales bacterium]
MKNPTLQNLWKAIFWVSFPFGILSFVLPIYGRQLGASALEIGGFFSAVSVVPVLVRPFLGRIMDRWGRRPFLLLGLIGYVIAMVVFSFSNNILQLTLARFIQGLGQAFLWLAAFTIVADVTQETGRGYDFGLIDEGVSRGALIGTTVGFVALFSLDQIASAGSQIWLILFAGYTIPALIALGIGWRGVPETRPHRTSETIPSKPLSRQLFTLMIIVFLTGASSMMVWPLLMIFLQDMLGAEVWGLAIAYLPAALINAFLPSRMGKLADRFGRKRPMASGFILGALASLLIPNLRSLGALSMLWAVENIGYTAAMPAQRAFVADIAGDDFRGTSYGLYTFAYFLGALIGPIAGGWFYDRAGPAVPFYINAGVLALGSLMVLIFLRESKRPAVIRAGL